MARICGKGNHVNVSTYFCRTACQWVCAPTEGRSSICQSPGVHASCVVSALPLMPVLVSGGSRQSVVKQMTRHADSSGHRITTHPSVRLQAQVCPDNVQI